MSRKSFRSWSKSSKAVAKEVRDFDDRDDLADVDEEGDVGAFVFFFFIFLGAFGILGGHVASEKIPKDGMFFGWSKSVLIKDKIIKQEHVRLIYFKNIQKNNQLGLIE